MLEVDPSIYEVVACNLVVTANRTDLQTRHTVEQSTSGVHAVRRQVASWWKPFQHTLKIMK